MYDTILVPVDGSAASDRAVDHASRLAGIHDAELHVLNVVEFAQARAAGGTVTGISDHTAETMADQGAAIVERAAERIPEEHAVETAVEEGTPSDRIQEHAVSTGVDLVVMGTHGRTGLERLALGSTAERVVRITQLPVLTVSPPES